MASHCIWHCRQTLSSPRLLPRHCSHLWGSEVPYLAGAAVQNAPQTLPHRRTPRLGPQHCPLCIITQPFPFNSAEVRMTKLRATLGVFVLFVFPQDYSFLQLPGLLVGTESRRPLNFFPTVGSLGQTSLSLYNLFSLSLFSPHLPSCMRASHV